MTETATHRKAVAPAYFKLLNGADGTPNGDFEAVVAVFNNVDLGGDRIMPGAFAASLDAWRKSGDPIPVIFSHQWDNLDAHVGTVDPSNARELLPGDAALPPELKDLGGLYTKGAMDIGEPFAGRLFSKMQRRSIREFSFAYDIPPGGSRATKDATELLAIDLIEVGPTLKGMNPATALLGTNARKSIEGMSSKDALEYLDGLVSPPPPAPPAGTKRLPMGSIPAGAVEESLKAIRDSAVLWAENKYRGELYAVHLEATYLADGKAIITAERWSDPWGEGPVWELAFTLDDKGATIGDATEQEVLVSFGPVSDRKAGLGKLKGRIATLSPGGAATVPSAPEAKAEEPARAKAEEPRGEALRTLVELEAIS